MNTIVVKEATGSLEKVHLVSHQVTGLCIGNYGFQVPLSLFPDILALGQLVGYQRICSKNLRA